MSLRKIRTQVKERIMKWDEGVKIIRHSETFKNNWPKNGFRVTKCEEE